jgi:hypothetical protein
MAANKTSDPRTDRHPGDGMPGSYPAPGESTPTKAPGGAGTGGQNDPTTQPGTSKGGQQPPRR